MDILPRKYEQVEKVSLFLLTRVNLMECGKHYETLIKHGSFSKSIAVVRRISSISLDCVFLELRVFQFHPEMFQDAFCWHHSTGNGLKAIGLDKIQWMEEILHQLNSWGWWSVPWFRGSFTSQVVQDFFHQQYFLSTMANLMFFWMSVYGVYGKASVVSNKYSQFFNTSKKTT